MKKYRVIVPWEGVEKGQELEVTSNGDFFYGRAIGKSFIAPHTLALLLHTGMIEEVKEDDGKWMPKLGDKCFSFNEGGVNSSIWRDHPFDYEVLDAFGVYRTEKEAQEMFDYLKKCVRDKREGV